ncbi:dTMP kinase [Candidatus Pacearchaeota archaeon]|nr:dTMP kinase [Candidatus Pacearchaeota archaeon]
MQRGKLIVFEGIDGSGTSTHVHRLAEKIELHDKYQSVLRTHEPWKSREIKRRLEQDKDAYSDPSEMTELYIDDRARHTRELILPNLRAETVVLCSRYKMSTCAYQWTQGVNLHDLLHMHDDRGILTPNLTFFLDVPREAAEQRIRTTRENIEKFERNSGFVDKLINAYNALVYMSEVDPRIFGEVIRVDGTKSIDDVANEIFQEYKTRLSN